MTLINNKYEYPNYREKIYRWQKKIFNNDGNAVASVTTILDSTKDKTHLIEWRKRVGEQKAQEITTEAPGVGTRMHKYLEDYVETGLMV